MIESYDDLIKYASNLSTDVDKLSFICSYVSSNVSFNYAEMIKAHLFDNIDELFEISTSVDINDPEYKEKVIKLLYDRLMELSEYVFTDDKLRDETISRIINGLELVPSNNLLKMLGNASPYINGNIYENGLLQYGVCNDISDFVSSYLNDLNIPYQRAIGRSHNLHEWLVVYIDDKPYHVDLTDAIYVRDGSCGLGGEITDYYMMTNDELFHLDSNRVITSIGKTVYDEEINQTNYTISLDMGGKNNV